MGRNMKLTEQMGGHWRQWDGGVQGDWDGLSNVQYARGKKRKRETDRAMCDTPEAKTQVKDRPTNVQNARGKNASERYCTAMLNLNF